MKEELMNRLRSFLGKEANASLVGVPASDEQITEAELRLNVKFDKDYIQFIQAFGGAYAGLPVHAFTNGSVMGNETVIELTQAFRKDFEEFEAGELLQNGYVISIDGSGDPIFISAEGKVLICYHDSGESKVIANSFAELIEENFFEW